MPQVWIQGRLLGLVTILGLAFTAGVAAPTLPVFAADTPITVSTHQNIISRREPLRVLVAVPKHEGNRLIVISWDTTSLDGHGAGSTLIDLTQESDPPEHFSREIKGLGPGEWQVVATLTRVVKGRPLTFSASLPHGVFVN
ncbi:MAG TPA: hypothetical protein VEI97_09260 [bacterium]|nr:hypothetical protein [bacterium]